MNRGSLTRRQMLALTGAAGCGAQQKQEDPVFSTGIQVVNILATVRDKATGALVTSLTRDDFTLDDERVPQTIRYFASHSDLPLTIGLIVDTSGSQERLLPAQREAAAVFAERVIREDQDQVFVLKFDRYVSLAQDLTSSRARVRKAVAGLERSPRPEGQAFNFAAAHTSRLFDAIETACQRYMMTGERRRALVVISDGVDSGFAGAIHRAIDAAIRSESVIFPICYRDPLATNPALLPQDAIRPKGGVRNLPEGTAMTGRDNMYKLALETGGSFFDVNEDTPIGQVFAMVDEELRSQYSIGFTPSQAGRPGRFRRVRLHLRNPGLDIRARAGYYPDAK